MFVWLCALFGLIVIFSLIKANVEEVKRMKKWNNNIVSEIKQNSTRKHNMKTEKELLVVAIARVQLLRIFVLVKKKRILTRAYIQEKKKNSKSKNGMRMKNMRLALILTLITFVIIVYDHFSRDTTPLVVVIFFFLVVFVFGIYAS